MQTTTTPTVAELTHAYGLEPRFYALWLDPYLAYSCANWDGARDLAAAQQAKLDAALDALRLPEHGRFLDIGCGWGSLLRRGRERGHHGVGLVPVAGQAAYCREQGFTIHTRTWQEHDDPQRYDAIASIGAFEHFAARRSGQDERRTQYTRFFGYCAQRLPEAGRLYLQTIGFMAESILEPDRLPKAQWLEIARRMHPVRQEWHNSMPPTSLTEILAAADREFEVVSVRARRHDYARTCAEWLARLQQRRDEALALAGEKTVRRFESYLRAAGPAFDQGLTNLYQIVFSKRESLGALSAVP